MEQRIGHYRIVAELGRGGMGVVYKAQEESLNRFVAIKVLGEHLSQNSEYVRRFVKEAQSAARLNHPNVVQIFFIGEDAGRHYFVMEYVAGRSLQEMIRDAGRITNPTAARWMLAAASGLAAAHDLGVIHRDVKPANLILSDRGLLKIADFGLALQPDDMTRLTASGVLLGTPGYLSPEQCRGEKLDGRSDIYSLGVTYYELLTGVMPFQADSPFALIQRIVEVEPPPVAEVNPEVDEATRQILGRMMAKDREARYADAHALVADLETYLATGAPAAAAAAIHTQPTMPMTPGGAATPAAPAAPPAAEAASAVTAAASGRRGLAVAAILVFLLLGVGAVATAAVLAWRSETIQRAWNTARDRVFGAAAEAQTASLPAAVDPSPIDTPPGPATSGTDAAAPPAAAARDPEVPAADGEGPFEARGGTAGPRDGQFLADKERPPTSATDQPPDRWPPTPALRPQASRRPTQAPPVAAPSLRAGGTAVVAVGEPLLAGAVEGYLEGRLGAAGIELVDEKGLADWPASFAGPPPAPTELLAALRGHSRRLVLAEVEYLGERPLYYLGRYETAFRSRVTLRAFDVATGTAAATSRSRDVEYTAVRVDRTVEQALAEDVLALVDELR